MSQAGQTDLAGVRLIKLYRQKDHRGEFVKTFNKEQFASEGFSREIRETFHSVSHKNVLRGMHFQVPPHDHEKLVCCIQGRVLDVVLDLRKSSPTFGMHASFVLCGATPLVVWIPAGVAHGFLALEDNCIVEYKTTTEYAPSHDRGVLWNSFGMAWPLEEKSIIVSERDDSHPRFDACRTLF